MADGQGRARGRSRGRAKAPTSQGPPEVPRGLPGPPPGLSRPGPPPGMAPSGPPPGMGPKLAPTSGRAMHRGAGRPVDETTAGLAQRVAQMSVGGGNGNGNGGNSVPVGRGNMRGKRQITVSQVRTRPETVITKQGTEGTVVKLTANYFSLVEIPDWCLYQYRVDFEPTVDLTKERKDLLKIQRNHIGADYIFDGTVLYTRKHHDKPLELYSQREADDTQVRITVRLVGVLDVGDQHYLQFFNIITRKCLSMLNLQLIQRDYYDSKAKIPVTDFNLELWPGYKTVIRQHETKVLMCAEIIHKVMRTDTCFNLLNDILNRRSSSSDFRTEYMKAVVGSVVLTDYNNRTYTISDVSWTDTPTSVFDRNGTKVSYIQYYKERYNINIREKKQPLLVSKSRPRERRAFEAKAVQKPGDDDPNLIFLIPELCRLTGLTDEMRANFNLMKAMSVHTRIAPRDRINRLMTMNSRLLNEQKVHAELAKWQLKLDRKLVEIEGRVLSKETILFGNTVTCPAGEDCDWTRNLRSNPMYSMPENGLSTWVMMYPAKVRTDAYSFVDALYTAAKGMSFNIEYPSYCELPDDKTATYLTMIEKVISTENPLLIFVVLLNNKADRYSAIKKKSLVDRAVPTQVLLAKNLNKKGVMSIATKVAIQINCKIGGAPWSIRVPLTGLMVIGFDVCHDKTSKGKSFGAMVASLNKTMTRYFSAVSHHSNGEELSNDLALNVIKALSCYRKHNNALPTHIVIYRDGVGDGQIPYVFEHEVVRVQEAIKSHYGENRSKLGVIIVSKKINTRIFADSNNPKPGTIVDDVITLPERYDFFIVSQYVNQGTVSPTSYNVIHDTLNLDPNKIQRLTFKLCHCYYNWSGTVRVPAPVQYAHKLAFLVSQSLHRPPNQALQELLFFL